MIKVYQSKTVQNDGQGDCFNACIASLLELPLRQVAKIYPRDPGDWLEQWRVWLADKGYRLTFCGIENPPKGYSLVTVHTERLYPDDHKRAGQHISHMCVAFDGQIIHDPYPTAAQSYNIRYYQELKPLSSAEISLHRLRAAGGVCIHGYLELCDICPKLDASK